MRLDSRLQKSPHGIYYLRIQRYGLDQRWSLRTRDPLLAAIAAHELSVKLLHMKINLDMSRPRLGWSMRTDGHNVEVKTEDNDADRQSGKEILAMVLETLKTKAATPLQTAPVPHAPISTLADVNSELIIKKTVTLEVAITEYEPFLLNRVAQGEIVEKTKRQALSTLDGLKVLFGPKFNMFELTDEIIQDKWFVNRRLTVENDTARRDLSHVRRFVEWAAFRSRKYTPAELTFSVKANGRNYDYFDAEDLRLIFNNLPAAAIEPWQFWITVLGLYTGARIGEIACLRADWFSVKSGLQTMFLAGNKTDTSPRTLPIHADLLAIGLLDFVEKRRKANHEMLFDVVFSKSNGWGDEPSGWFTEYKKTINLTAELKVFHSFRHTITDLLNQLEVGDKAGSQYTGHAPPGGVRNKVYGRKPLSLKVMQDSVVSKICWKSYCDWSPDLTLLKAKADKFL